MIAFVFPIGSAVDAERVRAFFGIVLEAARRSHGIPSQEKFALQIETQKSSLSRQLDGEGHLSFSKLVTHMDDDFWREFAWELLVTLGMPKRLRVAWRIGMAMLADRKDKRMAAVPHKRSA